MRQAVEFETEPKDLGRGAQDLESRGRFDATGELTTAKAALTWARHASGSNGFSDGGCDLEL